MITAERLPGHGMFGSANYILGHLNLFETGQMPDVSGITVDFGTSGLYYDPNCGSNWWTYYFEPIDFGEKENTQVIYSSNNQSNNAFQQRRKMPKSAAVEIVKKYIHIKPHIQEKVDAFAAQFFQNNYVIGIHYRGTDKSKEAPKVKYVNVLKEINKHIPNNIPYVLFIATDEMEFLELARSIYSTRVIAIDAHRQAIGSPGVHFAHKHNYSIGEEALIDACLLSKCDLLIRTSSNLSLWSTFFNPDLPVILLNQRTLTTLEPE